MLDPRAPLRSALREAEAELAYAVGHLEGEPSPDNLAKAIGAIGRVQALLGEIRRGLGRLLLEGEGGS